MATWIVGFDLKPSSRGAVRFASWLARSGTGAEPVALVGLHVIEREQLAPVFRLQSPAEVEQRAQAALERELADVGPRDLFDDLELAVGAHAHEVLAEQCGRRKADLVVVGRRMQEDARAAVRLGRNTRRLLRSLPATVVVVPPDYDRVSFGSGPILVAVQADADSVGAAHFAVATGKRLGRPVVAVHVLAPVDPILRAYVPETALEDLVDSERARAKARIGTWLQGQDLGDVELRILQGDPVEATAALVQEVRAPLVVTGSRRLPLVERAFVGSTSSRMAETVPVPVAVVPPAETSAA